MSHPSAFRQIEADSLRCPEASYLTNFGFGSAGNADAKSVHLEVQSVRFTPVRDKIADLSDAPLQPTTMIADRLG